MVKTGLELRPNYFRELGNYSMVHISRWAINERPPFAAEQGVEIIPIGDHEAFRQPDLLGDSEVLYPWATWPEKEGILIRSFPNNRQLSYEHDGCQPIFDGKRKEKN